MVSARRASRSPDRAIDSPSMNPGALLLAFAIAGALGDPLAARCAFADDAAPEANAPSPAPPGPPSPWMLVPVVSSSPKLGTAGGALGAYLHKFDPDSRVSIFGAMAQYTTTDSLVASAFA